MKTPTAYLLGSRQFLLPFNVLHVRHALHPTLSYRMLPYRMME